MIRLKSVTITLFILVLSAEANCGIARILVILLMYGLGVTTDR